MTSLLPVDPAAQGNSSFSHKLPGMQLAIDATSLSAFRTCPRLYYYNILRGLSPRQMSVDLQFGIWMHHVRENYDHARVTGLDHEAALDQVLDWVLNVTWDQELNRPWLSGHDLKTRGSLVQTAVWYLDAFGRDDPFETLILGNGKPAVELSFRFDSGLRTQAGEPILFCGHIDRIASLNDVPYIKDIKTASATPDKFWAAQFSPHTQFSMYTLAGRVALGIKVSSLIVDGIQIGVNFSRFGSHIVPRDEATLQEWLDDTAITIGQMEQCASAGYWPMNDQSCNKYRGCPFRDTCSRSPGSREAHLKSEFTSRVWDPLQIRGEA